MVGNFPTPFCVAFPGATHTRTHRMTAHTAPSPTAYQVAMRRAMELAERGPITGVNPRVGCTLVDDSGDIVAEGWHMGAGTPHAEVVALSKLQDKGLSARGMTAVVTLEPCSHTGKTGPCANALIDSGIDRVVYSVDDPGQESSGGATILRNAGIDVISGVEESAGRTLIERWLLAETLQRPWVTLKWAMTLDGRSAAADGSSQWITGQPTRQRVHYDRSRHDAIIVGINTVLLDNPQLTARKPDGSLYPHQPHAVVVGKRNVPRNSSLPSHPGGFTHIKEHGVQDALIQLYQAGMRSVYVEGGPTLASAFLKDRLADELHITMGPLLLGGPHTALSDIGVATMAEAHHLTIVDVHRLGDDLVVIAQPQKEGGH